VALNRLFPFIQRRFNDEAKSREKQEAKGEGEAMSGELGEANSRLDDKGRSEG
jgi:hypothetical protein